MCEVYFFSFAGVYRGQDHPWKGGLTFCWCQHNTFSFLFVCLFLTNSKYTMTSTHMTFYFWLPFNFFSLKCCTVWVCFVRVYVCVCKFMWRMRTTCMNSEYTAALYFIIVRGFCIGTKRIISLKALSGQRHPVLDFSASMANHITGSSSTHPDQIIVWCNDGALDETTSRFQGKWVTLVLFKLKSTCGNVSF